MLVNRKQMGPKYPDNMTSNSFYFGLRQFRDKNQIGAEANSIITVLPYIEMFYMLPLFHLGFNPTFIILLLLSLLHSSSQKYSTSAIHIDTVTTTSTLPTSNSFQRIMGQTISATQFFVYGKRHFTQYVL